MASIVLGLLTAASMVTTTFASPLSTVAATSVKKYTDGIAKPKVVLTSDAGEQNGFTLTWDSAESNDAPYYACTEHTFGKGKGADVWGTDWPVPVADEFEWHLFYDPLNCKQCLTTKLTSSIFFFFDFEYDEYILEYTGRHFDKNTFTTKDAISMIPVLEKWNLDPQYGIRSDYEYVRFGTEDGEYKFDIGNNDYTYVYKK